jgi:hypothetical protein
MYRFMTTDAIPFKESLDFYWEIVPEWQNWQLDFETVVFWYDCSMCPETPQWPDNLGWDRNRDGSVDARDLLLHRTSLPAPPAIPPFDLPWPFRLTRKWTGA